MTFYWLNAALVDLLCKQLEATMAASNQENKRIALLYLKTGGGHEAPARSIASYLSHKYPDNCTPLLFNCLESAPRYINGIVEDGYRLAQKKAKWVYSVLYELNKYKIFSWPTATLVGRPIKDYLREFVLPSKPDKIVVFHFFIVRPVVELLKELKLDIKVEVIVTDPFTAHPFWFMCKEPSYVLFSDRLKDFVVKKGWVPAQNIKVFPFIINSKFEKPMLEQEKDDIRRILKIDSAKKTILLLGGGDGMPGAMNILKSMASLKIDANVVVVCGRDEAQRKSLQAANLSADFASLSILGFVSYVYELINVADLVVTKCGPNSIMEILMCGKIPIVNSYIWEQEKGNLEYVLSNGLGLYETSPNKISSAAQRLISNESMLNHYKQRLSAIGISNGTNSVSEYIYA